MFSKVYSKSSYMSFFRKDIKDIKEDTGENLQSSYSHCKYLLKYSDQNMLPEVIYYKTSSNHVFLYSGLVGSWFIPPSTPHTQFGTPLSLSPSPGCERYSTVRNHRSAPYTSPYAHRTNSPSECYLLPPHVQELHHFSSGY